MCDAVGEGLHSTVGRQGFGVRRRRLIQPAAPLPPSCRPRTCILVLIVSAGCVVTVASRPAVMPEIINGAPGVLCRAGTWSRLSLRMGHTPR